MDNSYCAVYLGGDEPEYMSIGYIGECVNGILSRIPSRLKSLEVNIKRNDSFEAELRGEPLSHFSGYQYRLDIVPRTRITPDEFISDVQYLLRQLITMRYRAIAACDFEEYLSEGG